MRILRVSLMGTVAASLLLATALAPGALVAAEDPSMADHPFVGVWVTDSDPDDQIEGVELSIVGPGGTMVNVRPDASNAGVWVPTGDRTADLTFFVPMTDPEAGFLGFMIVRGDAVVAEDGQSFSGGWTIEFPPAMVDTDGMPAGQLGPGEVVGQRVNIEPMGTPVAPWPLPPPPDEEMTEVGGSE